MCLGIPGQITEILDPEQMCAVVDVDGVRREISIALLGVDGPEAATVGDWVLIHVGFAMAKIDEEEAAETMSMLRMLGSVYDDERSQLADGALPSGSSNEAGL